MGYLLIAMIYNGKNPFGCRLLNTENKQTLDVGLNNLKSVLMNNKATVYNVKIENGELKGENGALTRYCKLGTDYKPLEPGKLPIVIVNEINLTHYLVSDYTGTLRFLTLAETLMLAKRFGIANGKVVSRDNREYISAISGYYPYIEIKVEENNEKIPEQEKQKPLAQTRNENKVEVKEEPVKTEIKQPNPEEELIELLKPLQGKINRNQANAIVAYFKWKKQSNYSNKTSDEFDISEICKQLSGEKSDEKRNFQLCIAEQFVGLISTWDNLEKVFGPELAEQVYVFTYLKIPYTTYLIQCMAVEQSKNPVDNFKMTVPELSDDIDHIEGLTGIDRFAQYIDSNIKCLMGYKSSNFGTYSNLTERVLYYKMMESGYDMLVSTLPYVTAPSEEFAIDNFSDLVENINKYYLKTLSKHRDNDIYNLYAILKYDSDGFRSFTDEHLNELETYGINVLSAKSADVLSTRIPLNNLYKNGLVSVINKFGKYIYEDFVNQKEDQTNNQEDTQESRFSITITRTGKMSSIAWFKELDKIIGKDLEASDLNIKIARDIVGKYNRDSDISWKQKYRLDRAIVIAEEQAHKNGVTIIKNEPTENKSNKTSNKNSSSQQVENKIRTLDEAPDIKKMCEKLISKADSPEMTEVIEKYPKSLMICYTVTKNGWVSDKQANRIKEAYDMLTSQ